MSPRATSHPHGALPVLLLLAGTPGTVLLFPHVVYLIPIVAHHEKILNGAHHDFGGGATAHTCSERKQKLCVFSQCKSVGASE